LVSNRQGVRFDLRDAQQDTARLDPRDGIVLTASNGYGLEEASSDRLDPESVRRLANELCERAASYRPIPNEPALDIAVPETGDRDDATPMQMDPTGVPLADKLAQFEERRRRLREYDERAVQAVSQYTEQSLQQVVVNRASFATQQVRRVSLHLVVVISDGQRQRYGFIIRGATGGLEQLAVSDAEIAEAADTAVAMLGADPVPPGTYDVVTDNRTSGIIAHEAFGHGVETDMFLKERARAAEFVGKRVGSNLVNIIDDPTLPGAYGSYFVDDEGLPSTPTQIIRDGVFERGLTDLYSATRLGIARSANGRRESVQRKAYARMSNTFFAPGAHTRDELLASLDSGFLVGDSMSGMEDPKGWGMQISAQWAREYRNGQPTGRIFSPVALTGYVPDVLANVSMVSRDFSLDPGTCGKGWKELIPVSSGGPYLRTRCRLG
jgi:TldD protein